MLHSLRSSCRGECEGSLNEQTSDAVTYKKYRSFLCVCQLAIGAKLSDKAVRQWQYSIGGTLARRREGLDIITVDQYADVVLFMGKQVPEPKHTRPDIGPCLKPALEYPVDCNDTTG